MTMMMMKLVNRNANNSSKNWEYRDLSDTNLMTDDFEESF